MSGEGQTTITFKGETRSFRSVAHFMPALLEQFGMNSYIRTGEDGWCFVVLDEHISQKKAREIRKAFPEIAKIKKVVE